MPATVQTVLAARIDRLPAEEKRLLQTAAVIGKDVPFRAAPGHRRAPGGRASGQPVRGSRPASCSTRSRLFPELELHVQARADPRRGVRQPAPGAAQGAARPDRRGDRAAATPIAWTSTSSGWPTTPCAAELWDAGGGLLLARPAPRRMARSAPTARPRPGSSRRSRRSAHLPEEPRDARAGHRPPVRAPQLALAARRDPATLEATGRGRGAGRALGRPAAAGRDLRLLVNGYSTVGEHDAAVDVGRARGRDRRETSATSRRAPACVLDRLGA